MTAKYKQAPRAWFDLQGDSGADGCCRGAQFARRELLAFLHAFRGRVHSVHEDTAVSVHGYVEQPAPWALDRIDQLTLPLDGAYRYNGLGSGVNVYVVDTVRCRACLGV